MNTCCLQIDEVLITEAARMAQGLRYHKSIGNEEEPYTATCRRTFWVIYYMEKHMCFHGQVNSVSCHNFLFVVTVKRIFRAVGVNY